MLTKCNTVTISLFLEGLKGPTIHETIILIEIIPFFLDQAYLAAGHFTCFLNISYVWEVGVRVWPCPCP